MKELPSIGEAIEADDTVSQVIIDYIQTIIEGGGGTGTSQRIEVGVALGGSVTFVETYSVNPVVTAVPEVP